jgi:glycosyltransferase involved in cell wall biosynthesis
VIIYAARLHPEKGARLFVEAMAEVVKRMGPPADGKRDTRRMRARKALESLCSGDDSPYWIADDGCIALC